MAKLKIAKLGRMNPHMNQKGFSARVITNGKASYEEIAAEACRNTTMNKAEAKAALELFMETVAHMLKNGYIIDLGPVGTIYPSCSSGWVEKEEDLRLSDISLRAKYRPAKEVATALKAAKLQWAKEDKEEL